MSRGNEYRLLACGNIVVCFLALTLIGPELSAGEEHDSSRPWWKKEKIRFFWGDWHAMDEAGIPIEVTMKNLARVGATIFAENQHAGGDRGIGLGRGCNLQPSDGEGRTRASHPLLRECLGFRGIGVCGPGESATLHGSVR